MKLNYQPINWIKIGSYLEKGQQIIISEVGKAICEKHQINQPSLVVLADSLGVNPDAISHAFLDEGDHGLVVIPKLSENDLACRQRADPEIREFLERIKSNKGLPTGNVFVVS